MPIDPICGMQVNSSSKLTIQHKGKTYYFCNPNCLKKYAAQNNISLTRENIRRASYHPQAFYKNKIFILFALLASTILSSYALPILMPFRHVFLNYLKMIWWAIFLGLLLGGIIDHYIPREYISHILARKKISTIFYAVILGFLMSACSHGILALSIQLHKKGASNAAVVAFLLASPWANLPLTIMLFGFFGHKAFFIVFSAILIATITGLLYQVLEKNTLVEINHNIVHVEEDFSIFQDVRRRSRSYTFSLKSLLQDIEGVKNGMFSLANMVLWWILLGMAIASFAGAYIPSSFFNRFMGAHLGGLMVTLALATVVEVCSEGSAPLAFEIFKQTGALGNSFVFLMAGVVTDYTEIGLLWQNVGRKTAIWLPIITVPQVLLLGMIANYIFT